MEHQKQPRLNEARMRLLTGDHEVATVGFSVGYSSASQFSREYRRLFGTAPQPDRAQHGAGTILIGAPIANLQGCLRREE